ncbi:MAG: hypothetical protein OSA38_04255 [Candidatus Poseidoniaceae archaeon]|nr:hypothetical protein [Candidatus Poseidoniaceae archaeon]
MGDASEVRTAFVWAALLYAVLFVGHIVAAANEWVLVFRAVAIMITAVTFLVGPLMVFLVRTHDKGLRADAHRIGFHTSLLLSFGLAYAYAGPGFDARLTLGFLGITVVVHSITFLLLISLSGQKVD